jgi:SprT protein
MAFEKKQLTLLQVFIPEGSFDALFDYINKYGIHLSITKKRKTLHGNFSYNTVQKINKITVNGTLNRYAFLVTLLHEIAHCIALHTYGFNIAPHGKEWQNTYSKILQEFIALNVFTPEINIALAKHSFKPKASSCADLELEKILNKYDEGFAEETEYNQYVEQIPIGSFFETEQKKVYKMIGKRRTKYICQLLSNGELYLFTSIHLVKKLDTPYG